MKVELRVRPFWRRLLLAPWLFVFHARNIRPDGHWPRRWWIKLRGATMLTKVLLRPVNGHEEER